MSRPKTLLFILGFFVLPSITLASAAGPSTKVEMAFDTSHTLKVEDLLQASAWQKVEGKFVSLGFQDSAVWLRFVFSNQGQNILEETLELYAPLSDDLRLYVVEGGRVVDSIITGRRYLQEKKMGFKTALPVSIAAKGEKSVYVRIVSEDGIIMAWDSWNSMAYPESSSLFLAFQGLYLGAVIIFILYNLYLSWLLKDRVYFLGAMFSSVFLLVIMAFSGFLLQLDFTNSFWLHQRSTVILSCLSYPLAVMFTYDFLRLKSKLPKAKNYYLIYLILWVPCFLLTLTLPYKQSIFLQVFTLLPAASFVLVSSGLLVFQPGERVSRLFSFFWGFMILVVAFTVLSLAGISSFNFHPLIALELSCFLEIIFLSLTMSERIKFIKIESVDEERALQESLSVHESARAVQLQILGHPRPGRGLQSFGWSQAAQQTGGDWYKIIADRRGERTFVIVADVTGHGLASATLTSAVAGGIDYLFSSKVTDNLELDLAMEELAKVANEIVCNYYEENFKLMSMVILGVDSNVEKVFYLNAGHPQIVRNCRGHVQGILESGSLLGLTPTSCFTAHELTWGKGDIYALFTDGLIENRNVEGKQLGIRKIRRLVQEASSPAELCDITLDLFNGHSQDVPLADDTTFVAVRVV